MKITKHYIECTCHSFSHVLRLMEFTEEDDLLNAELSIESRLNISIPWYKRILVAFRYLLGYDSSCYYFGETLLNREEIIKLRDYLNGIINGNNNNKP